MRFASIIVPKQQTAQRTPASELIRRIVAGEPLVRVAADERDKELPLDLADRVRLVGEW
jgi:hypothetical protein